MASPSQNSESEIVLSLISHTNVGKTALARTLLRGDVGEVADSAHVTVVPEAHDWIQKDQFVARLWDTPGFGSNLAKLTRRLREGHNPVGWILHQMWDRIQDKSLWCSQEAIRNVHANADVVLYLVDASQSPSTIGYVDLEMQILDWIGKPVLVFLNQVGRPDRDRILEEEKEWREQLKNHDVVMGVSTLDAFTRCWVQEHLILERAAELVSGEKKTAAVMLARELAERNLEIFRKAIRRMAELITFSLIDTEPLKERSLLEKLQSLIANKEKNKEMETIQQAMYGRLAERTAAAINDLISLHGIDGETAEKLVRASKDDFDAPRDIEESVAAAIGGAVSGLVTGLAADLIAGGMTFGGGAVTGMLLGGATTYALAKGYNLTQTGNNRVRWTEAQFLSQLKFVAMLYLAVAHFGRGRGVWRDPENNPSLWEEVVERKIQEKKSKWSNLWKKGGSSANSEKVKKAVDVELGRLLSGVLVELYEEAADIF